MSEGIDTLETTLTQKGSPETQLGVNHNPYPEERRLSESPDEKIKRWIQEQGERDRQAAQLMRKSKKQRKARIA